MLCFSHNECNSSKKMHIVQNNRLLIIYCVMWHTGVTSQSSDFFGKNIFEIYAKHMLQTALIKKIYFFKLEIQFHLNVIDIAKCTLGKCKMYFWL